MDALFEFMLNTGDTATTNRRLINISQFIAIQMGVNEIDSLTPAKDFVGDKYPESGTDTTETGDVHYDMKFAKEKQGILPDTGEEEEQEVDEETLEEQTESTDGVKSASVQVPKGKKLKLPLMIKHFNIAYVRLAEHDTDKYIYYREVGKKKYSKHYRSGQKRMTQLMMYGYNIGTMFKRNDVVRSVPKANIKTYSAPVKEKTKIFEVDDKLILKAYDDIAQVDAIKSTISKVTFKDIAGNVVEKAVDTIVEYSLTDSEQLLVIDDALLTPEDKKDLENFC